MSLPFRRKQAIALLQTVFAKKATHLITIVDGRAEAVKVTFCPLNPLYQFGLSQTSGLDAELLCHLRRTNDRQDLIPEIPSP